MEFENVQEGDTLYVGERVSHSWNQGKSFFIPQKVIRTTKTQFILENYKKYHKKNGSEVAGEYGDRAYHLGERYSNIGAGYSEVKDETDEMKEFIIVLNIQRAILKDIESLRKIRIDSEMKLKDAKEIKSAMDKLKQHLNI